MLSSPRIIDIESAPVLEFIENITTKTYDLSHSLGGNLPYSVIREIAENFIHANFTECTVSVLDGGNTLRFSDQGPGIEKKSLVLQPGVSSATAQMKQFIKGVGSGFPIVREYLSHSNGFITIDDNATAGTIITLVLDDKGGSAVDTSEFARHSPLPTSVFNAPPNKPNAVANATFTDVSKSGQMPMQPAEQAPQAGKAVKTARLSAREERALALLLEKGMLGPSELAKPLKISPPTATRLLQKLEQAGMVETAQFKKRILSNTGLAYAQQLIGSVSTP